jgi:hypothetical protein
VINKVICPEDEIAVVLPARMIPDRATVTKRTGDVRYVLRHDLTLYTLDKNPTTVSGFFLVSDRGDVNQVQADKRFCWLVTAEGFVCEMRRSWKERAE